MTSGRYKTYNNNQLCLLKDKTRCARKALNAENSKIGCNHPENFGSLAFYNAKPVA